ncbi:MAG: DUF6079 family protein [Candidatus Scalindua sp.]|nr:DUF6079 family protein [Candidatus Scalindua sp.]
MTIGINTLLTQADALRFKLLAIIGENKAKKKMLIKTLKKDGWVLIDVESELLNLRKELGAEEVDFDIEIGPKIKEWFNTKPNKLILTNPSILYHDLFTKISPVGAFKYNSRNKNCIIFMEDEQKLGSRLYYGEVGKSDYYDREINDIVVADINEISDEYETHKPKQSIIAEPSEWDEEAIGHLFNFKQIKDVVDIDSDLKEKNRRQDIVSSYIISESLEQQIIEFFEDIEKPTHKARTVIGNYGSGKSHLVGFLVCLIEEPELSDLISNENIKNKLKELDRKFLTVQFELGAGRASLKQWFYGKIRKQLKSKYNITIPQFDPEKDFDDKENIAKIIDSIKKSGPTSGLLVVIDEISDFLDTKQKADMKADLQFLRVIGQVCQDQDMMFVGSMQEDVFTSPKFKDIAGEIGRIQERFQNIIIHKEDIKKVISERIVPKTSEQKHTLENRFKPFAEKIEDVSRNIDDYINLFPLTPFLIELFSDLPYFEKRGVIQFATSEIKYIQNEKFPYFLTFDNIYNLLENNPNKKNLEEIYEISKAMDIITQKINLLESKYQLDALKVVKGLAIYSLWNKREKGSTARELANNLMLLPQKKLFNVADNIALIIKKIREVTDGEYVKTFKDQSSGLEYFRFDTKAGIDPEQKISDKAGPVSEDEMEEELFNQLKEILELDPISGQADVFDDECVWQTVKSCRYGYIIFARKGCKFNTLPERDYSIVFISPLVEKIDKTFAKNQLTIKLHLEVVENVELLKEIVAIKGLLNNNFQKHIMSRKLDERINGYERAGTTVTGFKYRLSMLLIHFAECALNGEQKFIKKILSRERGSVSEVIEELKTSLFNEPFNGSYPSHPVYSIQLTSRNIGTSLSSIVTDLTRGDFNNLGRNTSQFLSSIDLLDSQGYPDLSHSKIALRILDILKKKKQQVTDIEKEIVTPLGDSDYGLEAEVVYFVLVVMTVLGKIYLQLKGGDKVDINNVREKIKSLAVFETIAYARLQEDYTYDFAARLLNALGLNGSKITIEKERFTAFREYKEKVNAIQQDIQNLGNAIDLLRQKQKIYVDIKQIQDNFDTITEIEWKALDIDNPTQFGKIESFNDKLPGFVIVLDKIRNLSGALCEYLDLIHDSFSYMNDAINLLTEHSLLVTDEQKFKTLKDFRDEIELICSDYPTLSDRSQRNPIKGKIQQFKKIYIFDLYLSAHAKYVGKKVDWNILNTYQNSETFKKLSILSHLTCINNVKFHQMVVSWNELKQYQCINHNLEDSLQKAVRCQQCLFPGHVNYSTIPATLSRIEDLIEELYESYEKTTLKEMREYRDNVQFLDKKSDKQLIEAILKEQNLPEQITQQMVQTINKLFKEIDIVEVDSEKIIKTLFPDQQMTTIDELRKSFLTLIEDLKKNKEEGSIRIKLK